MPARGEVSGLVASMGCGWPDDHWKERPIICRYALDRSHHRPLDIRTSVISRVVLTYKDFDGTGYPLVDVGNKYLTRAFYSNGLRHCWRFAFSSFECRPCARRHRVERGTLHRSERAAYVLGSAGSRPSERTLSDMFSC
jgi:hypothetical protein